jgi:hypothetical protein
MPKPFDATLKVMLEAGPADWLALAGLPVRPAVVIDSDVSAVSAASDKVIEVRDEPPWLFDLNFQTGPDASLPRRVHLYNALLHERHKHPVRSAVVLLTRDANLSAIDGRYVRRFPGEDPYLDFKYQVIRVWELSPEPLLTGGLATLPLAPISAIGRTELPAVVRRMGERLAQPALASVAPELWTASSILMGLKYERALIQRLVHEVRGMAESVTIQIFEEWGALKRARKSILRMGAMKIGTPAPDEVKQRIEAIDDLNRFDELELRLFQVNSWDDLLAEPGPAKRAKAPRRKKSS